MLLFWYRISIKLEKFWLSKILETTYKIWNGGSITNSRSDFSYRKPLLSLIVCKIVILPSSAFPSSSSPFLPATATVGRLPRRHQWICTPHPVLPSSLSSFPACLPFPATLPPAPALCPSSPCPVASLATPAWRQVLSASPSTGGQAVVGLLFGGGRSTRRRMAETECGRPGAVFILFHEHWAFSR